MQRKFLFAAALAGALLPASPIIAQESPATIAAEREEMEANYKRMSLRVEQMEDTLQNQQKRIATLVEEIHNLREQVDKLRAKGESTATQESIKQLAEKIEEVDKKRVADNELISKKLGNLGKELSTTLAPKITPLPPPTKTEKTPPSANEPPEKSFAYQIKDGDTLSRIVTDLRAQGWKVTQKQVMDINPSVNWSRLRVGQTIYIPQPAK
jgi:TolA-binding protein